MATGTEGRGERGDVDTGFGGGDRPYRPPSGSATDPNQTLEEGEELAIALALYSRNSSVENDKQFPYSDP